MVFIALYISFGKLYGNCLMAMLNMRYSLRQKRPMTREWGTKDWRPRPQVIVSIYSFLNVPLSNCIYISREVAFQYLSMSTWTFRGAPTDGTMEIIMLGTSL
ncbi:hypothetical protein M378DRAFT_351689 [Amanita muscaria Koide BX008]|uniref:Uncharacterized protein n=1 Tax=Amanita muscaria (strain Koide BX008) TaxID=946122 RepID=A0A0C2TIN5_AMAMK|nr:hypothetical protein M378DRAFT_351689 [Amanita muscaria Koide BX008]